MAITQQNRLVSVAPMMDCTDRHDRYFLRLIAPDVLLYTEMMTSHALFHGDPDYLLAFDQREHPVALQLGGCDPALLAHGARLGEKFGYDEINLNAGCPSPRVKKGRFGASLMLEPSLVAECIAAMKEQVSVPVTVKCRTGVDHEDNYSALQRFVYCVSQAGCEVFIIHARKAWLSGLSPKQNRDIPPLQYDLVYQLKKDFPHLTIVINGGIRSLAEINSHLLHVDGTMIGRAAYTHPFLLADIQQHCFDNKTIPQREKIIESFIPYVRKQLKKGIRLNSMTRHILGLFLGQRGAAAWRRYLSQHAHLPDADVIIIKQALALVGRINMG